jgi:hypothetical protein
VEIVSRGLPRHDAVGRRLVTVAPAAHPFDDPPPLRHVVAPELHALPPEAGLIVNMERLIRSEEFTAVVTMGEQLSSRDLALENPKIRRRSPIEPT